MKTLRIALSILIAGLAVSRAGIAADSPAAQGPAAPTIPPDQATVFELKYRGLSVPDDPLSYRAYWGWGGFKDITDPFVQAVKARVRESTLVYNGALPNAKWAVLELKDRQPVALYFDTDSDGKLSEQEKFLPVSPSRPGFSYSYAFITPDLALRTPDQREIPFRLLLVGSSYGSGETSWMWSPSCVLEGHAQLAGEPMRLVLYADGFSGSFTTFGSCSFALLRADQKLEGFISRNPLSSLIRHKGIFYRVKLSGAHAKDQIVRVAFERDTTPTGEVDVQLAGKETLRARLVSTRTTGVTDPSIHLATADALTVLPAGGYQLTAGTLAYGVRNGAEWQVTFNEGPAFTADRARPARIGLGTPTLSVRAIKEADRYASDPKEQSTFAKGTPVFLAPRIIGQAGEEYVRFSQKTAQVERMTDLKAHLTIVGPNGKRVVSADMEYG